MALTMLHADGHGAAGSGEGYYPCAQALVLGPLKRRGKGGVVMKDVFLVGDAELDEDFAEELKDACFQTPFGDYGLRSDY